MTLWNPAETRRKWNLSINPSERARIEAAMTPLARDATGLFDADAVFEGGGVLGTAFLGAVRVCHEIGIKWHALAGTSAGAITATLLATDMNVDQLESIIGRLDTMQFLTQKTSRLTFNGDPGDDLTHPVLLLTNLAMTGALGQYSSEPFRAWMDEILKWVGKPTFGDIWDRSREVSDRQLKVVVSDITRGEMKVLPDDLETSVRTSLGGAMVARPEYRAPLTPRQRQFSVAEAVRLSMSIPFFFEPGTLDHPTEGRSRIVDGGILSNFPLWLYDDDTPGKPPAWPTFGFRLIDRADAQPAPIETATDLLAAMMKTTMVARDRRYLSQRHQGRAIEIDLTGLPVTATQFGLSNDMKDQLYARGYMAAKEFFSTRWNWRRHLESRGF